MEEKSIYNLELHESIDSGGFNITRVAGGWIYRGWDYTNQDYYPDAVFVPLNNEFRKKKEAGFTD